MATILASAHVGQRFDPCVGQAQRVIQFAVAS
jgi:hypothetical protein